MYSVNEWSTRTADLRCALLTQDINAKNCFQYTKEYSELYNGLIKRVSAQVSRQVFGDDLPEGLILCSFGAPSRNELYGSSDADIIIYREEDTVKTQEFARFLKDILSQYGFSKVDLPAWGTFADISTYQSTSVTEANQINESCFITGDLGTRERFERLRQGNFSHYNVARNLFFQFNYFSQYFEKKFKKGSVNLKYSKSGTRNSLFLLWYSQLRKGIHRPIVTATEEGVRLLREENRISDDEQEHILNSVSYISFMRDQVMRSNPGDLDGILNLNDDMSLVKKIEKADKYVDLAKSSIWDGLLDYLFELYPSSWKTEFLRQLSGNRHDQRSEFQDDEILNTLKVWNIKEASPEACCTFDRLSDSNSWIVLASMLSNENCPSQTIDYIIRNTAVNRGFEYFFEIVTRNKNTKRETLEFIVDCDLVEARFKKAAKKKLGEYGPCQ